MGEFIVGVLAALAAFIVIGTAIDLDGGRKLEDCRREHNVYACELVAVPAPDTQETRP